MRKLLGLIAALGCITSLAWGQSGLPQYSVPYSGGVGTVGWLSVGPCPAGQVLGWNGAAPVCTVGGGGGGISTIIANVTPTSGFVDGDFIISLSGVVQDSGFSGNSFGSVQSVYAGCGTTTPNGPITTSGQIATQDLLATGAALSSTSINILTTYCGNTAKFTNVVTSNVSIPAAGSAGFPVGWYLDACTFNTGTAVFTPAAGTIAGASTFTFLAATTANPYCARILATATNVYDVKFVTPTLAVSNITVGVTSVNGGVNGECLAQSGGVLSNITCTASLVAGSTPLTGFGASRFLASNGSGTILADSGVLTTNVSLLSGNQTFSGSNIFSGTVNNTGTWQKNGNTMTFPASTATLASLNVDQTFTNKNTLNGVTVFGGALQVKLRNVSGVVTVSATTDYFLCVNTSGGVATINLPAPAGTNLTFLVKDCTGNAGTNAITVVPAAGTIDGAANAVMNQNYQSNSFTYNGTQWSIN